MTDDIPDSGTDRPAGQRAKYERVVAIVAHGEAARLDGVGEVAGFMLL